MQLIYLVNYRPSAIAMLIDWFPGVISCFTASFTDNAINLGDVLNLKNSDYSIFPFLFDLIYVLFEDIFQNKCCFLIATFSSLQVDGIRFSLRCFTFTVNRQVQHFQRCPERRPYRSVKRLVLLSLINLCYITKNMTLDR